MENETLGAAQAWTAQLMELLIGLAPKAAMLIGIVVLGLVLAYVLRRVVRWLAIKLKLDVLAERAGASRLLYSIGIRAGFDEVLGKLAFYATLGLTVHSVANVLNLPGLMSAISALIAFTPRLLASLGILLAGVLLAEMIQKVVQGIADKRNADDENASESSALAKGVYYCVVVLAGSMAAEQIGLQIELIHRLISIIAAAGCFGVALAFALGARDAFQNLIARHYVGKLYRPGDRIAWGDRQGTIIALSATSVLVQDGTDELSVPCHLILTRPVALQRSAAPNPDQANTPSEATPAPDETDDASDDAAPSDDATPDPHDA